MGLNRSRATVRTLPSVVPTLAQHRHRAALAGPGTKELLDHLAALGHIDHEGVLGAIADQARVQVRLPEILLARGLVGETDLYTALGQLWSMGSVDPAKETPDPRLIDRFGAETCLTNGLLPLRGLGAVTLILTAYPDEALRHKDRLTDLFGPVTFALAPYSKIESAINLLRGRALARRAENKVPDAVSCRRWTRFEGKFLAFGLVLVAICAALFPSATFQAALCLVVFGLVPVTGLKLAALIAGLWPPGNPAAAPPTIARRPTVSVIVALYRESDIAGRLVRRLGRLDYPHDLLDVILAVEEDDAVTREALSQTRLPPWMRVAIVPRGKVKTKPRALNFALNLCRGSIIGVYDAEDAPEADQIEKVVQRFHERGPQVACLQGILDFYNPNANWLARCFTLEYGGWFRVILPGLARLGLPIPLGGTTLFFRREALLDLGGWDAHNVTEDADLGIRLARRGYRTELINTTTYEEANCRALPWVKQRSRWIKGYMMTYGVHMRRPGQTLRDLGIWGFFGFQVLLLGSLVQVLLAPVMWAMLAIMLFGPALPEAGAVKLVASIMLPLSLVTEMTGMAVLGLGLKRSGQKVSALWVPTLTLYFPMAALASYKALWEAVMQPFYWDKTSHGHLSGGMGVPAKAPRTPPGPGSAA